VQLVDRIEKRRFVGREFLLFLWFESELFDATLETAQHGPFGLWLEKRLVLSEGKESTRITAPMPGIGREAKEALLRGQLPESAGIRIALHEDEKSFTLKAESLGVAGLKLETVLGKDEEGPNKLLQEMMGGGGGPKGGGKKRGRDESDEEHEAFYERMGMAADFEGLVETLYLDFLQLRLSAAWRETVLPLMRLWVDGKEFDVAPYQELRRTVRVPERPVELVRVPARAPDAAETVVATASDTEDEAASVAADGADDTALADLDAVASERDDAIVDAVVLADGLAAAEAHAALEGEGDDAEQAPEPVVRSVPELHALDEGQAASAE